MKRATTIAVALLVLLLAWLALTRSHDSGAGPEPASSARSNPGTHLPAASPEVAPRTPAAGSPEPPPPQVVPGREYRILHLADGTPLSGVEVEWSSDGSSGPVRSTTSSSSGALSLPAGTRIRGLRLPETHRAILPREGDLAGGGGPATVWVHDHVTIEVTIEAPEPPLEAASTETIVQAVMAVPDRGAEPLDLAWLAGHGVATGPFRAARIEGESARYTLTVPRIPEYRISATRAGFRPALESVNSKSGSSVIEVRLRLVPGFRLEGTLRDENGQALPGVAMDVFVVRWFPWGTDKPLSADLARSFGPTGGVVLGRTREGLLYVRVREQAVTDADGRFSLTTKSDGRVGFYAYPRGRGAIAHDLGAVTADVAGIDLVSASIAKGPFVTISMDGKPLANTKVSRQDFTDPLRPSVGMTTDGEGRVPQAWFVSGRYYNLRVPSTRKAGGFLRWAGESSIDIARLPEESPEPF
jgi:hypothetical protein